MKKIGCLLLSAMMLFPFAACNSTDGGETPSNTEETREEYFMENYQELYLSMDETYNLKQMLEYNSEIDDATAVQVSLSSDIATYENGILTPKQVGTCTLTLSQSEHVQTISLSVVASDDYDMSHMSIDVGRFYNKNIVFFGDSITHNWVKYPSGDIESEVETDSLGYPHHYIVQLNEICNLNSVANCAWSGGTMATPKESTHSERKVYKSFAYCTENNQAAIEKADYVFVWYGTNDYHEFFEIGTTDDTVSSCTKKSTFIGGMKYGLDKILEYNPNAKIIVSNLLARTCQTSEGAVKEEDLVKYNDAIETVASMYKVRLLNMYSLFTLREMRAKGNSQSTDTFYTNDGLHPNETGYDVITKFILNNGVASEELKK